MSFLENDILCVGGMKSKIFYLIKISISQIIKIIGLKSIYSINQYINWLFLCSIIDENGNYNIYSYDEMKNGIIASGKCNCLIIIMG